MARWKEIHLPICSEGGELAPTRQLAFVFMFCDRAARLAASQ